MQRWTTFALRAAFVAGFLVVLPLIALPSVSRLLDQLLYGTQSTVPPARESTDPFPPGKTTIAEAIPASFELPLPDESVPTADAERIHAPPPPSFGSAPNFLSAGHSPREHKNSPKPAADVGPLDHATAKKIDAVRSRLEELGAEYVRLEISEDGQTFHCLCDMLLGSSGGQTQPFEATRNDPIAAADAVLANVEAWREAEARPLARAKSGPRTPRR